MQGDDVDDDTHRDVLEGPDDTEDGPPESGAAGGSDDAHLQRELKTALSLHSVFGPAFNFLDPRQTFDDYLAAANAYNESFCTIYSKALFEPTSQLAAATEEQPPAPLLIPLQDAQTFIKAIRQIYISLQDYVEGIDKQNEHYLEAPLTLFLGLKHKDSFWHELASKKFLLREVKDYVKAHSLNFKLTGDDSEIIQELSRFFKAHGPNFFSEVYAPFTKCSFSDLNRRDNFAMDSVEVNSRQAGEETLLGSLTIFILLAMREERAERNLIIPQAIRDFFFWHTAKTTDCMLESTFQKHIENPELIQLSLLTSLLDTWKELASIRALALESETPHSPMSPPWAEGDSEPEAATPRGVASPAAQYYATPELYQLAVVRHLELLEFILACTHLTYIGLCSAFEKAKASQICQEHWPTESLKKLSVSIKSLVQAYESREAVGETMRHAADLALPADQEVDRLQLQTFAEALEAFRTAQAALATTPQTPTNPAIPRRSPSPSPHPSRGPSSRKGSPPPQEHLGFKPADIAHALHGASAAFREPTSGGAALEGPLPYYPSPTNSSQRSGDSGSSPDKSSPGGLPPLPRRHSDDGPSRPPVERGPRRGSGGAVSNLPLPSNI